MTISQKQIKRLVSNTRSDFEGLTTNAGELTLYVPKQQWYRRISDTVWLPLEDAVGRCDNAVDFITNEPPSPADGDRYLHIGNNGTSNVTSTTVTRYNVYEWSSVDNSWKDLQPTTGSMWWVESALSDNPYLFVKHLEPGFSLQARKIWPHFNTIVNAGTGTHTIDFNDFLTLTNVNPGDSVVLPKADGYYSRDRCIIVNKGSNNLTIDKDPADLFEYGATDPTTLPPNHMAYCQVPLAPTWQVLIWDISGAPNAPYVHTFLTSDWVLSGVNRELQIPATTHGKGTDSQISIYSGAAAPFTQVMVDAVILAADGSYTLRVPDGSQFDGKAIIS